MPNANDHNTVALISQLRDALQYAENELQRRCIISKQVRDALAAADGYLVG